MIDKIIESRTLFELADNLQVFLCNIGDSTNAQHQTIKLKRAVYEIASQFALGQYFSFICEPFILFDGRLSVIEYLYRQWPDKQSIKFERWLLKSIVTNIKSYIIEPEGDTITDDSIRRLVTTVHKQINFSHLVLKEQKLYIFRFPNTHQKWDGECITHNPNTEQAYCDLFLYHSRNRCKCPPEFVFMHELGHVFQIRITKSPMKIPESFYYVAGCIIPNIHSYNAIMVREIFADFFAMDIFFGTEHEKYIPYPVSIKSKEIMKAYIFALANTL